MPTALSAPEVDRGRLSDQFVGPYPKEQIEQSTYLDNFIQPKLIRDYSTAPTNSCVLFVKWMMYREDESWGNARYIVPNTTEPREGIGVLTKDGGGHIAYIVSVGEDEITILEANYYAGRLSSRTLKLNSPLIRGYLK